DRLVLHRRLLAHRVEEAIRLGEEVGEAVEELAAPDDEPRAERHQLLVPGAEGAGGEVAAAADLLEERVPLLERTAVLQEVVEVDGVGLAERGVEEAAALLGA